MNNELKRHKKSDTIKWIIVFVLILALIAGMLAVLTGGYRNWDVTTWFGGDSDESAPDRLVNVPVVDGNGNTLDKDNNPMPASGLLFASSLAETYAADGAPEYNSSNTVTLTATVRPATADNKLVDWTATWTNPSSSWASGKNVSDYLTVTQQSDGSLTATVTCKQAFGEQITVTVTSRQNTLAAASTTVDYYAKVPGANYTVKIGSNTYNVNNGDALPISPASATGEVAPVTSVGTLTEEYDYTVTARMTEQAEKDVMAYEFEGIRLGDMGEDYLNTANAYGTFNTMTVFDTIIECKILSGLVSDYWAEFLWAGVNDFFKKYTGDLFRFDITLTGKTTGKVFNTSLTAPADRTTLTVPVASVGISTGAVAF